MLARLSKAPTQSGYIFPTINPEKIPEDFLLSEVLTLSSVALALDKSNHHICQSLQQSG